MDVLHSHTISSARAPVHKQSCGLLPHTHTHPRGTLNTNARTGTRGCPAVNLSSDEPSGQRDDPTQCVLCVCVYRVCDLSLSLSCSTGGHLLHHLSTCTSPFLFSPFSAAEISCLPTAPASASTFALAQSARTDAGSTSSATAPHTTASSTTTHTGFLRRRAAPHNRTNDCSP